MIALNKIERRIDTIENNQPLHMCSGKKKKIIDVPLIA